MRRRPMFATKTRHRVRPNLGVCRYALWGVLVVALASSRALAQEEVSSPTEREASKPANEATQEVPAKEAEKAKSLGNQVNTANNPLADLVSVALHNYYFPTLNGVPGENANTFWLRMVTPFWRIIPRVSLPIRIAPATDPSGGVASITGLGDLNVFATFVVTPDTSSVIAGIGPIYTAPTATQDALGDGKHEIGLAALWVWTKGIFLVGSLINYQIGVGGDADRPRTQFIVAQPFAFFQLGKGYYIRTAPIWYFNLEQPGYNVPFGLGLGKVIPTEHVIFNLFAEPQFAMAIRGIGQPKVQIFVGLNVQFKTGGRKKRSKKADRTAVLVDQLMSDRRLKSQLQ
jgi:hypothetical protein